MSNILITGASGFIGTYLKKHLSNDYTLFTPSSKELNLTAQNQVDEYFLTHKIDYIIHLASKGARIYDGATLDEVAKPNIDMFNNLAKYASLKCPMINVGSGAEYDKSQNIFKVCETDFGKNVPKDSYGYSKYLISKEIEKRENILNLRFFGVYGVGEDKSRATSYIVNQNINNQPIILNQNVVFDFIYIDDLCKIVEFFIKNSTREKFVNVTPTKSISLLEIANFINKIGQYQSEVVVKKDGMNNEYTGDNTLLKSLIPNLSILSYEEGLTDFYKKMELLNGK